MVAYKKVSTNSEVGHFKSGDVHPIHSDRIFLNYSNGKEKWASPEAFQTQSDNKIAWRQSNRAYHLDYESKWKTRNRGALAYRESLRRSKSIPKESDIEEIEGIYKTCARFNSIFGNGTFQVDHTIPLTKGGKHAPNNLQIVPAKWNLSKNNTHNNRWEAPFGE